MKKWISILIFLMVAVVIFFMVKEINRNLDTQLEGRTCYERFCTKTTLDMFEECIDLGYESVGFATSEHYYLCDGNKVTKTCLEYEWYETNQTRVQLGMRCEEK